MTLTEAPSSPVDEPALAIDLRHGRHVDLKSTGETNAVNSKHKTRPLEVANLN